MQVRVGDEDGVSDGPDTWPDLILIKVNMDRYLCLSLHCIYLYDFSIR